jgi:hypothetical protein
VTIEAVDGGYPDPLRPSWLIVGALTISRETIAEAAVLPEASGFEAVKAVE